MILLLLIGGAGYVLNPGDPVEELAAVTAGASATKASLDTALTAEQQLLGAEALAGAVRARRRRKRRGGRGEKAGQGLVDAAKLAALGAATLAVAGKVLDLY